MATSQAITKSKIFSQSHTNIYNLINNRTNVPDPQYPSHTGAFSIASGHRKMVYSRAPDISGRNFENYPIIVVNPSTTRFSHYTLSGINAMVNWELLIEVRSSDRIRDVSGEPKGALWLDQVSDSLVELFNSTTTQGTLQDYGMYNVVLNSGRADTFNEGGELVYQREFVLVFNRFMEVSA